MALVAEEGQHWVARFEGGAAQLPRRGHRWDGLPGARRAELVLYCTGKLLRWRWRPSPGWDWRGSWSWSPTSREGFVLDYIVECAFPRARVYCHKDARAIFLSSHQKGRPLALERITR